MKNKLTYPQKMRHPRSSQPRPVGAQIVKATLFLRPPISIDLRNPQKQKRLPPHEK